MQLLSSVKKIPLFCWLIFFGACFLYFYNFANRVNFGPEQGLSLMTSAEYINGKFSLLGLPNLQRVTSTNLTLYSGSLFNYSLIPLLLIFNYDPLPITVFSGVVILLTGVLTMWFAASAYGKQVAIFAALLFFANAIMIWHATFIWILNYLPLIGILTVIAMYHYLLGTKPLILALIIGILSGIGFNLQYMYLFTIIFLGGLIFWKSNNKILDTCTFLVGVLMGNAPMVLFDLKHDFFHLRNLWQYFVDTVQNPGQGGIVYYHFLQFWPLLAIAGALLLKRVMKTTTFAAYGFLVVYVIVNFLSGWVNLSAPVGMPAEMKLADMDRAAQTIAAQKPQNFNVASSVPMDSSRAYPLRYLLQYRHGVRPENYETYSQVETVYTLAPLTQNVMTTGPWEFTAHSPQSAELLQPINKRFGVFVLSR